MVVARSPAERYIKFLILRGRMDDRAVRRELERRKLVPLAARFLRDLRADLRPPIPFYPRQVDHRPSATFLRLHGLEGIFRRDAAVNEALSITMRPRLQELVETLLLAGASADMVARGVEARRGADVSAAGIKAYSAYLFDLERLDATETRWLVTRRLRRGGTLDPDLVRHDARATAALMPSSYAAVVLAQLRLGRLPRAVDHRRLLEQARAVLSARVLERAIGGSAKDAQAASQLASALNVIDNIIARSADPNEGVMDVVRHVQLIADQSRLPSVRDLCGDHHTVDLQPVAVLDAGGAVGEPGDQEDLPAAG